MKFYCDQCNAKYAIADEKVRGKVLKVRCKKCDNVITVREQQSVDERRSDSDQKPSPPPRSFDPRRVQWHYSRNGESFGPFDYADLCARFARGDLGDECYVWTDSFSEWKPVAEVAAFEEALARSRRVKPRSKTLGVSQAVEAVGREQIDDDDSGADKTDPSGGDSDDADGARSMDTGRSDRLAKLRERLRANKHTQGADTDKDEGTRPEVSEAASTVGEDLAADGGEDASSEATDPDRPEVASSKVDEGQLAASPEVAESEEDGAPVEAEDAAKDAPAEEPAHQDGLFDGLDEEANAAPSDQSERSDRIPFPEASPSLDAGEVATEPSTEASDSITGSLLIQLDNIQKEGRGKKIALAAAALLVVVGVVAAGAYIVDRNTPEPPPEARADEADEDDDEKDEVVIPTYSDEEQERFKKLDKNARAEEKAGDKERAKSERGERPAGSKQGSAKSAGKGSAAKSEQKAESGGEDDELDEAFDGAKKRGDEGDEFADGLDDGAAAESGLDSPIAEGSGLSEATDGLRTDRDEAIYNPSDSLEERNSKGGEQKLSREDINRGISKIQRSVGNCRERHMRRSGELEARKIYMTMTVKGSGTVEDFELEPDRIQNTEFARCMQSHRTRWRFPSFDASEQKFRAPFILQ